VRNYAPAERQGAFGYRSAAVAEAHYTQRAFTEGARLGAPPKTRLHVAGHRVEPAREQQDISHDRVGNGLAEGSGRVADRDAAAARVHHVDRIDARAPLRDHAQTRRRVEHAARDLVVAADDGVNVADDRYQIALGELLDDAHGNHIAARCAELSLVTLERSHGAWRGDENFPALAVAHPG
jgi:hypothetical protein